MLISQPMNRFLNYGMVSCGGTTVGIALDYWSTGHWFDPRPSCCYGATVCKSFAHDCSPSII